VSLGYDPLAEGGTTQTAEGKKAFATKKIEVSLRKVTGWLK
jgi:hypothetical protein